MNTADASLDSLCQKALAGDSRAEAELFQALRVRFLPLAKRRVQVDHAEDLVQDALRIVFDRYGKRNDGPGILVWGLTVLRNVIGNYYQRRERDNQHLSFVDELPLDAGQQPEALTAFERAETRENLLAAIEELAQRFPRCGIIFRHLLSSLDIGGGAKAVSSRALALVQKEDPAMNRGRFYTALHRCRAQLRGVMTRLEEGSGYAPQS